MPIKSIVTIAFFYLINGPFCDLLEILGLSSEWIGFVDYSILFVCLLLLNFSTVREEFNRWKLQKNPRLRFLLETIGIMLLAYFLSNAIVNLTGHFGLDILPQNTENLKSHTDELPKILTFLMMVLYAPFIEELTFRHSMISWLDGTNKKYIVLMTTISILAFDLIHVIHIEEFLYYLPLSIGLTAVYLRNDRNFVASMIGHGMTNLVAFILILLGSL